MTGFVSGAPQRVSVDGYPLKLTSLDKVMYPLEGITKGDIIAYYAEVAPVMIPQVQGRPVTRKRWVDGVGTDEHPGQAFFQKNLEDSAPDWIPRGVIAHSGHTNTYPIANNRATLIWLAQLASIEVHVPQWRFEASGGRGNPDRLVLDLDPGPGVGLAECAEVARLAREILRDMGLDPLPVTSGSKGIHLYCALDSRQTSEEVSAVAKELARALEADHPGLIVSEMKKSLRAGRVLVDWSQNNANKTTVAPYSLRGRPHPYVAAPRTWEELESPDLGQLDFREVLQRVEGFPDPLIALAGRGTEDRLAKYRSMRDGEKTPEPVPQGRTDNGTAGPGTRGRFVIQEHHARRLHWDFRLERDGVLVSWAVPRGMPDDHRTNHLAVRTEDHPLEYLGFEGTIPHGEYGAGTVTIHDHGEYDLEKWTDGKEVIVVVHGERGGTRRYALIHTGENWLMHLMKDQPRQQLAPMLAATGSAGLLRAGDDPNQHEWAWEMKWDGIRALAFTDDSGLRLVSRNGSDLTATYPELAVISDELTAGTVLDGEIVALDAAGRPDFGLLQTRMNLVRRPDIERAARKTEVEYFVFDILVAGGRPLVNEHYDHRRAELERTIQPTGRVRVPPAFHGALSTAIASSRQLGLEGVVAKRRDSTYHAGRRSSAWLKIRHIRSQEVVIGGWRPGRGGRADTIGSLLLGVPAEKGLRYVGRVGTGFSEKELDALSSRLRRLSRPSSPFTDIPAADARDAHWIRPSLVGEVEFTQWTRAGRLRHPSWRGLRPDKAPSEVSA